MCALLFLFSTTVISLQVPFSKKKKKQNHDNSSNLQVSSLLWPQLSNLGPFPAHWICTENLTALHLHTQYIYDIMFNISYMLLRSNPSMLAAQRVWIAHNVLQEHIFSFSHFHFFIQSKHNIFQSKHGIGFVCKGGGIVFDVAPYMHHNFHSSHVGAY